MSTLLVVVVGVFTSIASRLSCDLTLAGKASLAAGLLASSVLLQSSAARADELDSTVETVVGAVKASALSTLLIRVPDPPGHFS